MSKEENKSTRSREHLANERTFLAWIRTSIALMGFGFVIVKFALFLKEISIVLAGKIVLPPKGYSGIIGVVMVALGVCLAILSFWQFKKVEKQINNNTYVSSSILSFVLSLIIIIGGILLMYYLLTSI